MPDLVREHECELPRPEAAVEQRVPEHDATARPDSHRLGIRKRRRVVHRLHVHRHSDDALRALEPGRDRSQPRIAESARADEVRADEREQQREPDERRGRGDPPASRRETREADDDRQRHAEEQGRAREREPAAEDVRGVADAREVVPPFPPQRQKAERKLQQPHEREAQHPEQHSRADRPGGRLAGPAGAVPRVDGEPQQLHDRPAPPHQVGEMRDGRRRVKLRACEVGVLVEVRQVQGRRNLRLPEDVRGDPERHE